VVGGVTPPGEVNAETVPGLDELVDGVDGVLGVDVGGRICSGARVPGFDVGDTCVGVSIDSRWWPTRGWKLSNRSGSSDRRHMRYWTFRSDIGSALFSAACIIGWTPVGTFSDLSCAQSAGPPAR
jgi:hypothetical protein